MHCAYISSSDLSTENTRLNGVKSKYQPDDQTYKLPHISVDQTTVKIVKHHGPEFCWKSLDAQNSSCNQNPKGSKEWNTQIPKRLPFYAAIKPQILQVHSHNHQTLTDASKSG